MHARAAGAAADSEYHAPVTPAELEVELAALRRELAAARGIAEAALSAAEAARTELELLRGRHLAPAAEVPADHLSSGPARAEAPEIPASAAEAPALPAEAAAPAPAAPAPAAVSAPQPASPPIALRSLAELVPDDDLSPGPSVYDLSPRPSASLVGLAVPRPDGAQIDLDRVDGVANDDEERRRARLAALEARLQRADHDAPRRARLLELAPGRNVPDPGHGLTKYVVAAVLTGAAIYFLWPLAFIPPIALLCLFLWRYEQNEGVTRLARGFAVPLHGRVLRDSTEVIAWLNAFWPAVVRPDDIWTSHRHIAIACEPDGFPILLDVQLEQARIDDNEYRPRVDFYIATTWPARLPLLRPGSSEMSPAIAELYARLRRAGFTIRVESEAGLLLHGSEGVVERVRSDPAQLVTLHGVVRDAIALARQLGATPAVSAVVGPRPA